MNFKPVDEARAKSMVDVIAMIKILWMKYPSMRFGQLLTNYVYPDGKVYYNETDNDLSLRMFSVIAMVDDDKPVKVVRKRYRFLIVLKKGNHVDRYYHTNLGMLIKRLYEAVEDGITSAMIYLENDEYGNRVKCRKVLFSTRKLIKKEVDNLSSSLQVEYCPTLKQEDGKRKRSIRVERS